MESESNRFLDKQAAKGQAEQLADAGKKLAKKLRGKSLHEFMVEARRLARRNPGLFIAGSIGIGFALARLVKASAAGTVDQGSEDRSNEYYRRHHGEQFRAPGTGEDAEACSKAQ